MENVQLAWVQELSQENASQASLLCLEGFEPIPIPVPEQVQSKKFTFSYL